MTRSRLSVSSGLRASRNAPPTCVGPSRACALDACARPRPGPRLAGDPGIGCPRSGFKSGSEQAAITAAIPAGRAPSTFLRVSLPPLCRRGRVPHLRLLCCRGRRASSPGSTSLRQFVRASCHHAVTHFLCPPLWTLSGGGGGSAAAPGPIPAVCAGSALPLSS